MYQSNKDHRLVAREFIQKYETVLARIGVDAAKQVYQCAVAELDEHKDNAYYLIAIVRCSWMLRDQLPNYWDTFNRVYQYFVQSRGEDNARQLLVGIYQHAVANNLLKQT